MNILIIDDENMLGESIRKYLNLLSYNAEYCESSSEGMKRIAEGNYDIVITDIRMPGYSGIDIIERVKDISFDTEVIIITGFATIENAIAALKAGAADFLRKPFDFEDLHVSIKKTVRYHELWNSKHSTRQLIAHKRSEHERHLGSSSYIGESPEAAVVRSMITKASAASDSTILITGESGTGKELAAHLIHTGSPRSSGPFIPVNCSGFSPSLIESELFGHEKGAFTGAEIMRKGVFELADEGTLFFDEIGDMPAGLQSRLLRVLEEKRVRRVGGSRSVGVDFRLIAATNKDISVLTDKGEFRQDLFFRLNIMRIDLPPLRGRTEDIKLLVDHYFNYLTTLLRKPLHGISEEAREKLSAYGFPGNVRELRNMIERAIILCDTDILTGDLFFDPVPSIRISMQPSPDLPFLNIEKLQSCAVSEALSQSKGNRTRAAEILNISRYTLLRLLKKYGLDEK